jgi:hypothetical protein
LPELPQPNAESAWISNKTNAGYVFLCGKMSAFCHLSILLLICLERHYSLQAHLRFSRATASFNQ